MRYKVGLTLIFCALVVLGGKPNMASAQEGLRRLRELQQQNAEKALEMEGATLDYLKSNPKEALNVQKDLREYGLRAQAQVANQLLAFGEQNLKAAQIQGDLDLKAAGLAYQYWYASNQFALQGQAQVTADWLAGQQVAQGWGYLGLQAQAQNQQFLLEWRHHHHR